MDNQTSTPRLPQTESTDSSEQLSPADASAAQAETTDTAQSVESSDSEATTDSEISADAETVTDSETSESEGAAAGSTAEPTATDADTDTDTDTEDTDASETDGGASDKPKRPRVTKVMRFIVAPILVAMAVICGIFAGLTATIWKPDPTATATATTQTRYIITDPGVLPLGNEQVNITVKANSAKSDVCLAVGSSADVSGWVASHGFTRVEGLETWSKLTTSTQAASKGTSTDSADDADSASDTESNLALKDSDMWLSAKCGTGSASIKWTASDTNQALIVDTNPSAVAKETKGTKATVSLTWVRTEVLNLTTPLIFLAALLVVAAVLSATVFAILPQKRRKKQLERARAQHDAEDVEMGLDSPRWVNDHIASQQRAQRTSHRVRAPRKPLFSRLGAKSKKIDEELKATEEAPTIVDVGNVNMVARQQSEAETASPAAAASADAMAAYFARLTQERLGDDSGEDPLESTEQADQTDQPDSAEEETSDDESSNSKETNES